MTRNESTIRSEGTAMSAQLHKAHGQRIDANGDPIQLHQWLARLHARFIPGKPLPLVPAPA
jgi:hypothetical protein